MLSSTFSSLRRSSFSLCDSSCLTSFLRFLGKGCFNHEGNKNFRKIVGLFLESYSEATSKLEKSAIVSAIIQTVRSQSGEGGFVKKDTRTGFWQEVGDHLA